MTSLPSWDHPGLHFMPGSGCNPLLNHTRVSRQTSTGFKALGWDSNPHSKILECLHTGVVCDQRDALLQPPLKSGPGVQHTQTQSATGLQLQGCVHRLRNSSRALWRPERALQQAGRSCGQLPQQLQQQPHRRPAVRAGRSGWAPGLSDLSFRVSRTLPSSGLAEAFVCHPSSLLGAVTRSCT